MRVRTRTSRQNDTLDNPRPSFRPFDRWFLLVVCLMTLARVVYVTTAPLADLTNRSTDDAYYYFGVARNIAVGNGVTFDQINTTNGFHPLWMLCLLPIFYFQEDPEGALRAVFCLVSVIAGTVVWLAYCSFRPHTGPAAALAGVSALLLPFFLHPLINGLETGLLLLLLFLTLWAAQEYDLFALAAGRSKNVLLGALMGLIALCRLDSIFIIVSLFGLIVIRYVRTRGTGPSNAIFAAKIAQIGLAAVLLVGPYLAWNFLNYGHFLPISGALKTSFPSLSLSAHKLVTISSRYGQAQLVFSSAVILWIVLGSQRRASQAVPSGLAVRAPTDIVLAMWIGCWLHFCNTLLFMNWAVHWWHFASYAPVTLFLGSMVVDRIQRRLGSGARGAVFGTGIVASLLAIAAVGSYIATQHRGVHHEPWHEAAIWARTELPATAVIGMTDCGLFGYFCDRPTVNLDGIINGYEYQEALRDNRLTDYLGACGVTHIADNEVQYRDDAYVIRLPARLYNRHGGAIVAMPEAEVYRSGVYTGAVHFTDRVRFVIWDIERLHILNDSADLPQLLGNRNR